MRPFTLLVAALGCCAVHAADASAQYVYPPGAPPVVQYRSAPAVSPPRPYRFSDEPLMSVNRSYLGYSNFIDTSGYPPAPGYVTRYGQAVNQGLIPVRTRPRWFVGRRGYRY
jgi:hypothetical protein